MNVNDSDFLLAGLGLVIGYITTFPLEFRHRRLFHMALVPVLLVGMRQLIPDGRDLATNLAGFTGFLVPMLLLAVLLAPSAGWIVSGALVSVLENPDHGPAHALELHQVRRRISSGLHEEAYKLLARNLRSAQPTYEALYLKAALEQEMGMTARARRTVRQMGKFAIHDAQKQFAAAELSSLAALPRAPKSPEVEETNPAFGCLPKASSNGNRPPTNLAGRASPKSKTQHDCKTFSPAKNRL